MIYFQNGVFLPNEDRIAETFAVTCLVTAATAAAAFFPTPLHEVTHLGWEMWAWRRQAFHITGVVLPKAVHVLKS